MTLQQQLDDYTQGMKSRMPEAALATMDKALKELIDSGILNKTVKVGDSFPLFSLPNQDGEIISLSALLDKGPVVISMFRGIWCPFCNIELRALEAQHQAVQDAGATLLAIAPQTRDNAAKNRTEQGLSFDLLSDEGNQLAKQLGTGFALSKDLKQLYISFGIDLPAVNGDDSWTLPMPLRAIIDTAGTVRYLDINPDYKVRPEVSDTLAALKAL